MRPKDQNRPQAELFLIKLERLVSAEHELVVLSKQIEWKRFSEKFGEQFYRKEGRPGIATRLMVGLHYLKYSYNLSDEEVVYRWVENPYWQYFCGEEYFQTTLPIDPSSMTRWRKRVGSDGSKELLLETLAVGVSMKALKLSELEVLNVDTTVQEKNVTFPTDAKLLNRMRVNLVVLAQELGVELRQSYARVGRKALIMQQRYAHAKHMKRARRQLRKLRTYLGRVTRDISRKIAGNAYLEEQFSQLLNTANQLLDEIRYKRGRTIFSIHAKEVECIGKGKAHRPYEFGVKVSVVATNKSGFILDCDTCPDRPHDAKTLKPSLERAEKNVGRLLHGAKVSVDLGYRGNKVGKTYRVLHPRLKRVLKSERKIIRRRSAIEAIISHLKLDCRMGRNFLQGSVGDQMNAIFAAAAFNFKKLLAYIGLIYLALKISHFFKLICETSLPNNSNFKWQTCAYS